MNAMELIPNLANMDIGATVIQDDKHHGNVKYHRVPGGWVVFGGGAAAFVPLNLDSINDLRVNVGQKPLTAEEYANQNNQEGKEETKVTPKPEPVATPSTVKKTKSFKPTNDIPDVMTEKE